MQPTSPNTHYKHPGFPNRCDITAPTLIALMIPERYSCIGELILHYFPLASAQQVREAITIKEQAI